jgi:hypothetical protein
MSALFACPFCRELYEKGEVEVCPQCDLPLRPLDELPPSHEAQLLDAGLRLPPEDEPLPWTFLGRGRGVLMLLAVVGMALFFAPWLHESSPEIRQWSGMQFARRLPWLWAAWVGWVVMLALVATRRTIRQMRGSRLAVMLLAATVLVTVVLRAVLVPDSHPLVPLRFRWGWGLYGAGFVALLASALALRFGGSAVDMPTQELRSGDETLH